MSSKVSRTYLPRSSESHCLSPSCAGRFPVVPRHRTLVVGAQKVPPCQKWAKAA